MVREKRYHHGNLREALLKAALGLIAEVGPSGFTMRELARRAGVSHNAPYRHFSNRDELLAVVATEGFRELAAWMRKQTEVGDSARDQLKKSGLAYISFALRRPEYFAVMFDAPIPHGGQRDLEEASQEGFSILVNFVRLCQANGVLPPGKTRERALLAWSLVHGIARLAITNRLPYRSIGEVLKFADFAIEESLPPTVVRENTG